MSAFSALKILDEEIINQLTKFCWWFDTKYDKDSIWLVKAMLFVGFPSLFALLMFFFGKKEDDFVVAFVMGHLFGILFEWLFFSVFSSTQKIARYATKGPNKNRVNYTLLAIRAIIFFNLIIHLFFAPHQLDDEEKIVSVTFFMALLPSFQLILYLLCTEPVPPVTKIKRIEVVKKSRFQFNPQKN